MTQHTFRTVLLWHDSRGGEVECPVAVTYDYSRGYPATLEEPGCDAQIEITAIKPIDGDTIVPDHFSESAELIDECFEHLENEHAAAEEHRAEMRREELREFRA
jgi:hypothetical protein